MNPEPPLITAQINEGVLTRVLKDLGLILRPYTYQGTARRILSELDRKEYVLMHRDDL